MRLRRAYILPAGRSNGRRVRLREGAAPALPQHAGGAELILDVFLQPRLTDQPEKGARLRLGLGLGLGLGSESGPGAELGLGLGLGLGQGLELGLRRHSPWSGPSEEWCHGRAA